MLECTPRKGRVLLLERAFANPSLRPADQRDADIAANDQLAPAIVQIHLARIGIAGVRVEDRSAVPGSAVALHSGDENHADDRLVFQHTVAASAEMSGIV